MEGTCNFLWDLPEEKGEAERNPQWAERVRYPEEFIANLTPITVAARPKA
jgi:hypothetical protein